MVIVDDGYSAESDIENLVNDLFEEFAGKSGDRRYAVDRDMNVLYDADIGEPSETLDSWLANFHFDLDEDEAVFSVFHRDFYQMGYRLAEEAEKRINHEIVLYKGW